MGCEPLEGFYCMKFVQKILSVIVSTLKQTDKRLTKRQKSTGEWQRRRQTKNLRDEKQFFQLKEKQRGSRAAGMT